MTNTLSLNLLKDLSIGGVLPSDYEALRPFLINDAALMAEFKEQATAVLTTAADKDFVAVINEDGIHIVNKTTFVGLKVSKGADGVYRYAAPAAVYATNSVLLVAASVVEAIVNKAFAKFDGKNYKGVITDPNALKTTVAITPNLTGITVVSAAVKNIAHKITYVAADFSLQLNSGIVQTVPYATGQITLSDNAGSTLVLNVVKASLPVGNVTAGMYGVSIDSNVVQPSNVTGVLLLDPVGPIGAYDLAFTFVGLTLAWDGGTAQAIPASNMLTLVGTSGNAITVFVLPAYLPGSDQSDIGLAVSGGKLVPNATFGNNAKLVDIGNLI